MTDEELKELVASLAISHRETERILQQSKLETDRLFQESKLETDRLFQESKLETDRQLQETKRILQESQLEVDKQLKALRVEIGGIGNKFGSFAEGMALPTIEKILHDEFGLNRFQPNAKSLKDDKTLEVDVLGYSNGINNKVVVVEVKSHLKPRDVEQVLRIIEAFPSFFPEHADKKLYGMVAAVAVSKEAKERVIEAGLYFGRIHNEQFKLTLPPHFVPKCFNETC